MEILPSLQKLVKISQQSFLLLIYERLPRMGNALLGII